MLQVKEIEVDIGKKLGELHFHVDQVQIYRGLFLVVALLGIFGRFMLPGGSGLEYSSWPSYVLSITGLIGFLFTINSRYRKHLDNLAFVVASLLAISLAHWAFQSQMDPEFSYISILLLFFVPFVFQRRRNLFMFVVLTAAVFYLAVIFVPKTETNLFLFFGLFVISGTIDYFLNQQRLSAIYALHNSDATRQTEMSIFDRIFDDSPIGIALLNRNMTFQEVNRSFAAKLASQANELRGRSIFDFIVGNENENGERGQALPLLDDIFAGRLEQGTEERNYRRADGSSVLLQTAFSKVVNGKEEVVLALMSVEDVTRRKNYERELKNYTKQLETGVFESKELSQLLKNSMREPLSKMSSILGNLVLKAELEGGDASPVLLYDLEEERQHLEEMMEGLSYYCGIESIPEKATWINPSNPLRSACQALEALIVDKNADISFESFPEVPYHEKELAEVFYQLISNALKFSKSQEAPQIRINWIEAERELIIVVRDNGKGMNRTDKEHAFDLFYKGEGERKSEGSGIGLSIAKKIIEQNGGSISLQSNLVDGTTVQFSIKK